jgi:nucleoside-diphosphate-sugar epimerase
MPVTTPRSILITGANGNLGRKLVDGFLKFDWCSNIIGADRSFEPGLPENGKLRRVEVDLNQASNTLLGIFAEADAVVHLATTDPSPAATWSDAAASFDMTMNLLEAASQGSKRFVFASSNHVMGGYKETDVALTPDALKPTLPPMPGTRFRISGTVLTPAAYAASKLMCERACAVKAAASSMTAVSLRIGWCQGGENHPRTMQSTGVPIESADDDDQARHDLTWFRNMWLSNRDLVGVVGAAILADARSWPAPGVTVNAMSGNTGMPWDLGPTRRLLGYQPQDDVWRELDKG